MQKFQILHISDLHINTNKKFDISVVLDPLVDRVKKDFAKGHKPEIIVVTGDVAYSGKKEEYDVSKEFFNKLLKAVKLTPENLFIVPGNHDVNRKKYRPGDIPSYKNMTDLNKELEDYRADLLKGMDDYLEFVKTDYPHLETRLEGLLPFVLSYKSDSGKHIGLVGLNSAWMCRKTPDKNEIAIGEYQINNAMKELEALGKHDLVINIFHHPLEWLWSVDRKMCKQYFTHSITLSGHIHDAEARCGKDLDCEICEFHAGASYEGSDLPAYNSYQYIRVDFASQKIMLDFRKYDIAKREWVLAGEKGDDGEKDFEIPWLTMKKTDSPVSLLDIPDTYREWIIDRCQNMDIEKLAEKESVIKVSLPEIFVPLYAYLDDSETGKQKPRRKREESSELSLEHEINEPADIEDLIIKSEYLLIEGDPGAGKTTLFKHMAYSIAKDVSLKGLEDFLPLLIYLKDLKHFFDNEKGLPESKATAEKVMTYYCNDKGLDLEIIKKYCKVKRAIFLLDGLDELPPNYRKVVVNSFKDFSIHYKGNKFVLSGRPHGIDEPVKDRFGKWHTKILPLNMKQVEMFVTKWFDYVYQEGSAVGGKTAKQMINEVRGHTGVSKLIETPLMLTAICILYYDNRVLPEQRAELYRKFINNLLYRRFDEPELIHNFLKALAYKMHSRNERGIDRNEAVKVLGDIYKGIHPHSKEFTALFDQIEPECGLLKREDGQYTFRHLTFQEFLSADYLIDRETDYSKAIEKYWNNEWYHEVIELYVGLLSIGNKGWANTIVGDALKKRDRKPYKRWKIACQCVIDIHKDRRNPAVLELARKKLLTIMESDVEPITRAEASETLGWLGDTRDLKGFKPVTNGKYILKGLDMEVTIDPFEIGQFPVTNRWYEEFINNDGYLRPDEFWSKEGKKWLKHSKAEQPLVWDERKWRCPNSPVVGVTWYESYAFTKWLTDINKDKYIYRLPTEEEWQAAAAGFEGREYPWGDWKDNVCNTREAKIEKTSPIGIFTKGRTPDTEIYDLSGNVWEWTSSDYASKQSLDDFKFEKDWSKSKQYPVLRGGSWFDYRYYARCAYRFRFDPDLRSDFVGFRCVRTLKK